MCSACFHALAVVFLAHHYSAAHYEFLLRSDTQRPLRVVMIRRVTIAGGTVPFEQGHEVHILMRCSPNMQLSPSWHASTYIPICSRSRRPVSGVQDQHGLGLVLPFGGSLSQSRLGLPRYIPGLKDSVRSHTPRVVTH